MVSRKTCAIALIAALLAAGCGSESQCTRLGTDQAENLEVIEGHAEKLGLSTTSFEISYILGAAYAAGQLEHGQESGPVTLCLRSGSDGQTEFRLQTDSNKVSPEWRSIAAPRSSQ